MKGLVSEKNKLHRVVKLVEAENKLLTNYFEAYQLSSDKVKYEY